MHVVNIQEVFELADKYPDVWPSALADTFEMPYPWMALAYKQDSDIIIISLYDQEEHEGWVIFDYVVNGYVIYTGELNLNPLEDGYMYSNIGTSNEYSSRMISIYGEEAFSRINHEQINGIIDLIKTSVKLMHVKNVTLEDYDPNEHISRQVRRARERKGRGPLIKYKILYINPYGRQPKKLATGRKTGIKQAVHTTRGHFKTFTQDKPAFGKPWGVGTFWVGPHIRGNPEFGLVMKDYHIEIDESGLMPIIQEVRKQCH